MCQLHGWDVKGQGGAPAQGSVGTPPSGPRLEQPQWLSRALIGLDIMSKSTNK